MLVQNQVSSGNALNQPSLEAAAGTTAAQNETPLATPAGGGAAPGGQFEVLRGTRSDVLFNTTVHADGAKPASGGLQHENVHGGTNGESNKGTADKTRPVLDALKRVSPGFKELPGGWENGINAPPADICDMLPVDEKTCHAFNKHADDR